MSWLTAGEVKRMHLGLAGLGGAITVPAADAVVLEVAKGNVLQLEAMAKAIGRPPIFATDSYFSKWGAWLDMWQAFYDDGMSRLQSDEARSEFINAFRLARNATDKIRLNDQGAWELLMSALEGSPLKTLNVIVGDPSGFTKDLADAAGGLGFPWNVLAWVKDHPLATGAAGLGALWLMRRK